MAKRRNFGGLYANLICVIAVLCVSPVYGQYILNTSTKVYHSNSGCRAVSRIAPENYEVSATVPAGYNACGHPGCGPDKNAPVRTTQPEVRQITPTPAVRQPMPTPAARQTVPATQWTPGNALPTPAPATPSEQITPQPKEKPPLQWGWQKVARVIDGDTFVLENGWTVRLIGADTPETVKTGTPEQPFGKEATEYTKAFMILGKNWVYLEEDGDKTDRYDRQLAMVYIQVPSYGRPEDRKTYFLNDLLIWEGLARVQTQYNYSQKMKDKFTQSEKEARESEEGIWSNAL